MEEENKKLQSCSGYLQFITNTCKSSDSKIISQFQNLILFNESFLTK